VKCLLVSLGFIFSAPASADIVAAGREIAELNCAICHAIGTNDASQHAEAPPLRELGQRYPLDDLAEGFVEGVEVGHPDMPHFQTTPAQFEALRSYLLTIQQPSQ
jgi:cytochrome c